MPWGIGRVRQPGQTGIILQNLVIIKGVAKADVPAIQQPPECFKLKALTAHLACGMVAGACAGQAAGGRAILIFHSLIAFQNMETCECHTQIAMEKGAFKASFNLLPQYRLQPPGMAVG